MKKALLALLVLILLLAAGAGLYLAKKHTSTPLMKEQAPTASSNNMFSSLQDALSNKSLSLMCDFTNASGIHVVAYIKNGAIRSNITGKTPQESGNVIMKDKKIYFWNATMGMMMDMPAMTVTPTPGASSTQTAAFDVEKYKDSCKPAVVADSLFDLPANVKFTDASQVMHAMPSVGAPTGSTGGYTVPTQYQQYMQHPSPAQ